MVTSIFPLKVTTLATLFNTKSLVVNVVFEDPSVVETEVTAPLNPAVVPVMPPLNVPPAFGIAASAVV